jgi:hypothetical protein
VDTFYFPTQGQGIGTGSSWSTAYAAGVLAAVRDRMPALSVDQAEQLLTSTAGGGAAGPLLDATAAFRSGGQGSLVDQYTPAAPSGGAGGGGGGGGFGGGFAGGGGGAKNDEDPAPAVPASVAPVTSAPPAPAVVPEAPVVMSRDELDEAACEKRGGWCLRPAFASVEQMRGGKLRLQLVRVPAKATVVIRVDGKTVVRSKPRRKHGRWVKRSNFLVRTSRSYREVSITYVQAGRGNSLSLRLTRADLDA